MRTAQKCRVDPGVTPVNVGVTVREGGLTLIELVITLSIVAILVSLGAPAFDRMMRELRLVAAVDRFYAEILTTRSEAIKRGGTVIMCRTGDPLDLAGDGENPRCRSNIHPGGAALPSHDWSHGWLTYTTRPGFHGERNYDPGDGDRLIGTGDVDFARKGITVRTNNSGNSWLTFQGDGSLNETNVVHYAICDARGVNHGRLITIFLDGQARIDDLPTATVTACTPPA